MADACEHLQAHITPCRAKTHFFKDLDLSTVLDPPSDVGVCGTQIICSIGPSCQSIEMLCAMLRAGMSVARIDLTWGPLEYHMRSLDNLQLAMQKTHSMCGVMVDTLGREIMVRRPFTLDSDGWPQHEEPFAVAAGEAVVMTTQEMWEGDDDDSCHPAAGPLKKPEALVEADGVHEADGLPAVPNWGWEEVPFRPAGARVLPVSYPRFHEMAQIGDLIYVGRYLACGAAGQASLYLRVVAAEGQDILCIAENDAFLEGLLTVYHTERSGGGLTNLQNDLPLLSPYDHHCLRRIAARHEVDFVAMSYTRTAADVQGAREAVKAMGMNDTRLIAKIESRQALFNTEAIIRCCEGVIISRGNLGLDCPPEKMAMIQKSLVQACNLLGRSCALTRVVDTMADAPRPTRAEATDIANAVLDNVDGIVLGAETLRGKYPLETVETLVRICCEAEAVFDHQRHYEHLMSAAAEVVTNQQNHSYHTQQLQLQRSQRRHEPPPIFQAACDNEPAAQHGPPVPAPAVLSNPAALQKPPRVGRARSKSSSGIPSPPSKPSDPPTLYPRIHDSPQDNYRHRLSINTPRSPDRTPRDDDAARGPEPLFRPPSPPRAQPATPADPGNPPTLTPFEPPAYPAIAHPIQGPALASLGPLATYPLPSPASTEWLCAPPPLLHRAESNSLQFAATPFAIPAGPPSPEQFKLEAIASAAVNTADTIKAKLIVVYTHTGYTAQLVAKYRPSIPITTIVVPRLVSDGLKWRLSGKQSARQCLMTRGISPQLARSHNEEQMLEEIVYQAGARGVVVPGDQVVVVQKVKDDYCMKVVEVDRGGRGVRGARVNGGAARDMALAMQGVMAVTRTLSEPMNVVDRVACGVRGGGGGRQLVSSLSAMGDYNVIEEEDESMVEDLVGGMNIL